MSKLLFLIVMTAAAGLASTISISGPDTISGIWPNVTGTPCDPNAAGCILGSPTQYAIYGLQLTSPTGANQPWTLKIETNYPPCSNTTAAGPVPGCAPNGVIATPGNVIPPAPYGSSMLLDSIADVLIHWNNQDYAIVLAQHVNNGNTVDNYVAGDLYQAPNVSSDVVYADTLVSPARHLPVWLAPGGTLLGAGSISVVSGGNGTPAAYTITDQFFAPAGFLGTGNVTILASSFECANGSLAGGGSFTGGSTVPEPSTLSLSFGALLFAAYRVRRIAQR